MRHVVLTILIAAILSACATSAERYLAKGDFIKARNEFIESCRRGGLLKSGNKGACVQDAIARCEFSDDHLDDCKKGGLALQDSSLKSDAENARNAFSQGCEQALANGNKLYSDCRLALSSMDCFGGKNEACEQFTKDFGRKRERFSVAILTAGCENGALSVCQYYYQTVSKPANVVELARKACAADKGDGCKAKDLLERLEHDRAEQKMARDEELQKQQRTQAAAFQETIERESSSGKCEPSRFQEYSSIAANLRTRVREQTKYAWDLSAHEVVPLSTTSHNFQFSHSRREHVVVILSNSELKSFSVKDSKGNEGGIIGKSSPDFFWLQPTFVLAASRDYQGAKHLMMNPLEAGSVSLSGTGCSLIVVFSK